MHMFIQQTFTEHLLLFGTEQIIINKAHDQDKTSSYHTVGTADI